VPRTSKYFLRVCSRSRQTSKPVFRDTKRVYCLNLLFLSHRVVLHMVEQIGDFIQHNLILVLALVTVPLKYVAVRLCKDTEAEWPTILSIPEDLAYVALGIILADAISPSGAFRRHYADSKHAVTNIAILILGNVFLALLIHRVSQYTSRAFKNFRAADQARAHFVSKDETQLELPILASDTAFQHVFQQHLISFCLSYALQYFLVLLWLHRLARVVASN